MVTTVPDTDARTVTVYGSAAGYAQDITVGRHRLAADEPVAAGGADSGPNPYDLLLAALGSCMSITATMYARRKEWPLEAVTVRLQHSRIHAADCEVCETTAALIDHVDCYVEFAGVLSQEQRARILEITDKCPVHRTLTATMHIRSHLAHGQENQAGR
jgi:putative redox protein